MKQFTILFVFALMSALCIAPHDAHASLPLYELMDTDNLFSENEHSSTNGIESDIVAYIGTASASIQAFIYSISSEPVINALCDAVGRGVDVRAVSDSDRYSTGHEALERCGVTIVYDTRSDASMHIKAIVVDESRVLFGTQNFTTSGLNHDNGMMTIVNDGCVANAFIHEFEELYAGNFASNAPTPVPVCHTARGTWEIYFPPSDTLSESVYESVIDSATVSLASHLFVMTRWSTRDAYIRAHDNGVNMFLVFDAHQASQSYSATHGLESAGVPFKKDLWAGQAHCKCFVVDAHTANPVTVFGSLNPSTRGFTASNEVFVVVRDDHTLARWMHQRITSAYTTLPDVEMYEGQEVNAEAGLACFDGRDNDYDDYIDSVDWDCDESTQAQCEDGLDNDGDGFTDLDDLDCYYYGKVSPGVFIEYEFGLDIVIGWIYGQFELIEVYWVPNPEPWEDRMAFAEYLGEGGKERRFHVEDASEGWYVVCGSKEEWTMCGGVYFDGDPSPQPNLN